MFYVRCRATHTSLLVQYINKTKAELASLGEWLHINCMLPSDRAKIHDDILRGLIPIQELIEDRGSVPLPEPPKSRVEKLLAAVDSTLIETDEPEETDSWNMENTPGGQLTYVFERKSDSSTL